MRHVNKLYSYQTLILEEAKKTILNRLLKIHGSKLLNRKQKNLLTVLQTIRHVNYS